MSEHNNDVAMDKDSPFEEEVAHYACWSLTELHNLARELEIPNYEKLTREALIEMMIRRLF
jgi:hypothetical protein